MSTDYKNLSIEQKIGQLFFIGLPGEDFDEATKELLKNISPGGICFFARNTKNAEKTRNLIENVTEHLMFQPFFSIDQEGGLVDRLRRIVEPIPSAKDIGRSGNPEMAEKLAGLTAEVIRILGFNMNFAPVVDVTNETRKGFIMDNQQRTFGNSKEETFQYTDMYLKKLQEGGVLSCLKHFPGIGAVEFDPHEELPSVELDRDELFETDLFPFLNHFEQNDVDAVMTAHTVYPNFDLQETDSNGKLLPSSLSHNIVTRLLRDELNFEGLALTDDLEMGAIIKNYGIGEATKMAFLAGSDFLLICNDENAIHQGFDAILDAYKSGEITENRIDDSLEKIFRVRQKLQKPLAFSESKLMELSQEIKELKENL